MELSLHYLLMARQSALSSNAVPRQNIRRAAFFRYLIWKIHLSSPHRHLGLFQTATFISFPPHGSIAHSKAIPHNWTRAICE